MKLSKLNLDKKKINKKQAIEDMRYLQKMISGKSVYANIRLVYKRVPKHRSRSYSTQFNALRGN
jgi:hypothetical protein